MMRSLQNVRDLAAELLEALHERLTRQPEPAYVHLERETIKRKVPLGVIDFPVREGDTIHVMGFKFTAGVNMQTGTLVMVGKHGLIVPFRES